MAVFQLFRTAVRRTSYGLSFLGMFMLLPLMLLTSAEVVGRAVWSRPIPGTMELSSYFLAVFVLLGVAYTQQAKAHVRVEMLTSRLSPRAAAGFEVFTLLLSLFIIGVLAWQGWTGGMEERAVSDMLRVPQRPFKLLVSLAGVLLFLELVVDLGEACGRLVRR
ncbi:MAG: TRAP transporter small permease [Deferrisomatales bacterium]|nr:TRAP transporter small permease [Deferrisomatales bacterium]